MIFCFLQPMTVLIWPRRRRRVALESTIFRIITPAWMSSLMSEISPPCLGDSCFTRILVAVLPLTDGHLLSQGDWPYAHQNFEARIGVISWNMHFLTVSIQNKPNWVLKTG